MTFAEAFALFVKFFFLLTPPFVISVFLSVTKDCDPEEKARMAIKLTLVIILISGILLFGGGFIFDVFGITLEAFRIGTGALLFLTAISLVNGDPATVKVYSSPSSLVVVPLAIPVTLGPASVGALLVYGGDLKMGLPLITGFAAITLAIICVGGLIWMSSFIEKAIGKSGLVVLSKLTGLILAALSCQMIFEGIGKFITMAINASNAVPK